MFEDISVMDLEGYSLRDKNILKLEIRFVTGQIYEHFFDLLSEDAKYLNFNPEDAHRSIIKYPRLGGVREC